MSWPCARRANLMPWQRASTAYVGAHPARAQGTALTLTLSAASAALHLRRQVRAMQAIQHGRTGTAITHFLQSGDDALIVRLADQLLEGYLANGMVSATPPTPPPPRGRAVGKGAGTAASDDECNGSRPRPSRDARHACVPRDCRGPWSGSGSERSPRVLAAVLRFSRALQGRAPVAG